jgi:transposase InsO family protein
MIQAWVATATADGLSDKRACAVLGLTPRTLQRWQRPAGPKTVPPTARPRPVNALTRAEAAAVVSVIRSPVHADESCRELAVSLMHGIPAISVSPVSVWRYQVALACNGPRGRQVRARHLGAPDTDWVTGPNQLWDGDVTWLTTAERSVFFYLYSLLDHFSRKVVAWLIGEAFTSDWVQALWDQGLITEGLLDQPSGQWPAFLSDRGAQMRSHSTQHYFDKLGIRQLLSRPRTPNDNPRIEAHFGTVKTHPIYPGFFADQPTAVTYFTSFYQWYNTTHVLTTLNLLTPQQVHTGQAATLLAARAAHAARAQIARRTACHHPFTLEALIAEPLPDVSRYPVYSWAGPQNGSAKQATPIA